MDSLILLCWVDIPSVSRRRIHAYVCGESVGAVGILPIDSAKSLHSSDEQVTLGSIWEAIRGRLQKQSPLSTSG